MVRTIRSFAAMQEAWSEHGKQQKARRLFASAAYAFKQAEMYARLANDAKLVMEKAEQKQAIYQQWYVVTYSAVLANPFIIIHAGSNL